MHESVNGPSSPDHLRWHRQRAKSRAIAIVLGAVLFGTGSALAKAWSPLAVNTDRPDDQWMAREIFDRRTFEADRRLNVRADPAVFDFLVDHPDFAAAVHRGLGLDTFQIREERDRHHVVQYHVVHDYARGTFWIAERRPDRVVYLATGSYEHPLLRAAGVRLRARSLVVETFESDATCSQGLRTQLRLHAYLEIENPVLGPVLRRFGSLVRGAFESKLTAAYRIAPGLSEMALRDHDRLLEKVRQIPNLDRDHLGQFEALVRAQPLLSTSLACLG